VETLAAKNAQLAADLDAARRRLRGAGALTDEELAAELPPRMARNLAAAHDVANDMLDRAKNDAMLIRLNADQVATQLVDGAKAEAARIVRGTMAEAKAQVAAARAEGKQIVQSAQAHREKLLTGLEERAARVEHEWQRLHDYRQRLEQAYDQVARTLSEARSAMSAGAEPPRPAALDRRERAERTERDDRQASPSVVGRGTRTSKPVVLEETSAPAPVAPVAAVAPVTPVVGDRTRRVAPGTPASGVVRAPGREGDGRRAGVFDWSRTAVAAPKADVDSQPAPAYAAIPYADTDAVAG
jgi:hypothetical protein